MANARKAKAVQRDDGKEASEWKRATTWISFAGVLLSAAALITTWFTIHGDRQARHNQDVAIKGVQDAIRILYLNQIQPVQDAVEKALDAKQVLPKSEQDRAKRSAATLVKGAPELAQSWKLVAAVATYQSAAQQPEPFVDKHLPECGSAPMAGAELTEIPPELQTVMHLKFPTQISS